MTTRTYAIHGLGCLIFIAQGCGRTEPPAAAPSNSTNFATCNPVDEPAEEPPAAAAANSTPETAVPNAAATDRTAAERIVADLKRLADPLTTPEEWESALARILEQGPAAVPVLAARLSSDAPLEREMAATMLAVIGDGLEQARQPLREALRDESAYVRANAATALCQLPGADDAVIPVLTDLLQSSDPNLRQIAAVNLGNFGPEAAPFVDRLAGSLDDRRPDVLMPVVELLGRIGPAAEAAAPKLRQIAFEQTGDVQAAATAALEQIESGDTNVE